MSVRLTVVDWPMMKSQIVAGAKCYYIDHGISWDIVNTDGMTISEIMKPEQVEMLGGDFALAWPPAYGVDFRENYLPTMLRSKLSITEEETHNVSTDA